MIRLLLLLTASLACAQSDPNFHGWYQYFGDHPIQGTRWGVHLEGQVRRHDVARSWQNLLLRPAVNFNVNKYIDLTAGYAYVSYHRYGAYPGRRGHENRLFQDFKVRHEVGKVVLQHRLRFENRWVSTLPSYENRFRFTLRGTVPIGKSRHYITAWNEMFTPVAPETFPSFSDQNRAAVLWGRKINKYWRTEVGYMLQTVWQRNRLVREDNHTLVISLWSTQPFGKRN